MVYSFRTSVRLKQVTQSENVLFMQENNLISAGEHTDTAQLQLQQQHLRSRSNRQLASNMISFLSMVNLLMPRQVCLLYLSG